MKKIFIVSLLALFTMFATTSTLSAGNATKGQKIFKKKFRKYCRFSGVKFSRKHTQGEWEELWEDGDFQKEALHICPRLKIKKIKKKWWKDVYEFSYKYASDGVVPKC